MNMPALVHPPLPALHAALARLARADIAHALGASGLLAALDLVDHVNDWDVTCDTDLATLAALFADAPTTPFGNSGIHADHKLQIEGGGIELIAHFAFFVPGGIVQIPTLVTRTWQGVPVGSPEAWAAAYWLMGELEDDERRRDRAERLFAWLAAHGTDERALALLAAQPLPQALAARLAALPSR